MRLQSELGTVGKRNRRRPTAHGSWLTAQLTSPQGVEAEEMMGLQYLQGHLVPFCTQSEDGRQVASGQKHPEGKERSSAGGDPVGPPALAWRSRSINIETDGYRGNKIGGTRKRIRAS